MAENQLSQCRVCMENKKVSVSIKTVMSPGTSVASNLQDLTSVHVSINDGLPQFICMNCHQELIFCVDFRNKTIESDKKFREIANISSIKDENDYEEPLGNLEEDEKIFIEQLQVFPELPATDHYFNDDFEECNESIDHKDDLGDLLKETQSKKDKPQIRYETKLNKKCCMCSMKFPEEQLLFDHVKEVHPKGVVSKSKYYSTKHKYACSFCNQKFWKKLNFYAHFHNPNFVEPKRHPPKSTAEPNDSTVVKEEPHNTTASEEDEEAASDNKDLDNFLKQTKQVKRRKIVYATNVTTCCMCSEEFEEESHLVDHVNAVHPNGAVSKDKYYSTKHRWVCKFCNQRFWQRTFLMDHFEDPKFVEPKIYAHWKNQSRKKQRFVCSQCGADYGSKDSLDIHMAQQHIKDAAHNCDECDMVFTHRIVLARHKRQVHGSKTLTKTEEEPTEEPVPAPDIANNCNAEETNESEDDLNEFLEQTKKKPTRPTIRYYTKMTRCCMCSKRFQREDLLLNHVKNVHPDGAVSKDKFYSIKNKFACPLCNQKFWKKQHFYEHFKNPNYVEPKRHAKDRKYSKPKPVEPLVCSYCGSYFSSKETLTIHEAAKHIQEAKVKCIDCDKCFTHRKLMMRHRQTVHRNEIYTCDICKREFPGLDYLRRHMGVHMEIKNFQCPFCPKSFSFRNVFNNHIVTNHTENTHPHVCDICGKSYKWQNDVRKHKLIEHEGTFPTTCKYCGKGYHAHSSKNYHQKRCSLNPNPGQL